MSLNFAVLIPINDICLQHDMLLGTYQMCFINVLVCFEKDLIEFLSNLVQKSRVRVIQLDQDNLTHNTPEIN